MRFRKVLFWLHLASGCVAGIVILIMSVTGTLLMYEKQMIAWADREYRVAAPAGAERLPVETLLARFRDAKGALPPAFTMHSDPGEPAAGVFGREGTTYINPYSGEVLGEGSTVVRTFVRVAIDWHRWLGAQGESRPIGKAVTGACNLAFLFLVCSGLYLWWPRKWSWQSVRAVTLFRGGLSGKARDFNWHNVIGFWCCVPLFFVVISATVISYPWASNLVYRLAGGEPPSAGGPGGGGPPRQRGAGGGANADLNLKGIDQLWTQAEGQVPGWRTISLRLPNSDRAPLTFTIDRGTAGQPQKRGTLTLNRRTGEVESWQPFESYDRGRRLRSWLRFVHTGEYYGFTGQTIAGIASAGGAVLVWTGLALAWRRFRGWRARSGARVRESEKEDTRPATMKV